MGIHIRRLGRTLGIIISITMLIGPLSLWHEARASESGGYIQGGELLAPMHPETAFRLGEGDRGIKGWTFDALGKRFELDLSSNDQLVSALPNVRREEALAKNTFLRGSIRGIKDSWVRLTVTALGTSGMIWDGEQLYVVEPAVRVEERLSLDQPLPKDDRRLVIYRFDDQSHPPLTCGTESHGRGMIEHDYEALRSDLQSNLETLEANVHNGVLQVVVVEDQFWNGNSVEIFNALDGIYTDNFGVSISISNIEQAEIYPRRGPDLLSAFGNYIRDRGRIGIAHLMSGRTDTEWAGIAYVGELCNSDSIGVSTYTRNFSIMVGIVAHEIGHNANASHDQNVGCGSGWIMDAWANGSHKFSTCSIDTMTPFLAGASCIEPDPDPDPEPDHDSDGDVDGSDLSEWSKRLQRSEFNDVNKAVEAFAALYGHV